MHLTLTKYLDNLGWNNLSFRGISHEIFIGCHFVAAIMALKLIAARIAIGRPAFTCAASFIFLPHEDAAQMIERQEDADENNVIYISVDKY
jgi:hypothetical protein